MKNYLDRLLNIQHCSITLIENYVKVIHMSYVIEELRKNLEEKERKLAESERRREETERRLKEKNQKLLKALKDAGIEAPVDEDETE